MVTSRVGLVYSTVYCDSPSLYPLIHVVPVVLLVTLVCTVPAISFVPMVPLISTSMIPVVPLVCTGSLIPVVLVVIGQVVRYTGITQSGKQHKPGEVHGHTTFEVL